MGTPAPLPLFLAAGSRESGALCAGTVAAVRSFIRERVREAGSVKAGCADAGRILGVTDRWARGVLYGEAATVTGGIARRLATHRAARAARISTPSFATAQRGLPLSMRGRP